MKADMRGRDFIMTPDWSNEELELVLDTAKDLKRRFAMGEPHRLLEGKSLFMVFLDRCARTRSAFVAGMAQLGGQAHDFTQDVTRIGQGESPKDIGMVLSRYGHGIAVRHSMAPGEGNRYIRDVADWATKPVINMQCDLDHPTQTLTDLMTIRERFGNNLKGLKMTVSWAYAPGEARPLSVTQGLLMLMTRFGVEVTLAHPPEYPLMGEPTSIAKDNCERYGGKLRTVDNMDAAVKDADVVCAMNWGPLEVYRRPQEVLEVSKKYKSWICDSRKMGMAKRHAIYMHGLPAERNCEVTDEVIDGPQSVVYDEAENRLHTAKALMALTMA